MNMLFLKLRLKVFSYSMLLIKNFKIDLEF